MGEAEVLLQITGRLQSVSASTALDKNFVKAAKLPSMVAIPLSAFEVDPAMDSTFDLARVKTLMLTFSNAPNVGTKVALTDVQLQNFKR